MSRVDAKNQKGQEPPQGQSGLPGPHSSPRRAAESVEDISGPVAPLRPVRLRCEYAANPLDMGVARPRLSWQSDDPRRGARQTAYQVVAASVAQNLATAPLWDSGRVESGPVHPHRLRR